jgi:hAT family C-terminal dimerisation region
MLTSVPDDQNATDFWLSKSQQFKVLAPFALDILALPASERVFSHCGDLTRGKRNRKSKTLERSVFMKVNKKLLSAISEDN